uniref:Uncharacterized protein n=1 Tax=Arundo donax TaxID=35708 RepID=A0A0A9EZX6_ARUDO
MVAWVYKLYIAFLPDALCTHCKSFS